MQQRPNRPRPGVGAPQRSAQSRSKATVFFIINRISFPRPPVSPVVLYVTVLIPISFQRHERHSPSGMMSAEGAPTRSSGTHIRTAIAATSDLFIFAHGRKVPISSLPFKIPARYSA